MEIRTGETHYDRVPYPSCPHPQTHPDRLAVIGRLFGSSRAPLPRCRVLEIGCGDGANLAPMAWCLPQAEFVGLDLAERPIQRGQQMVRELALANLKLVRGNLLELNGAWGRFDYIIAHGVYSWVPAEVREHLLASCRELLMPQGIAFVSYNAFPGAHLKEVLREEMLFHVRGFTSPEERVQQALAFARFLAQGQDTRDSHRLWLKAELEHILEHAEGHLYHDELAEINQPFYFTQFMEAAARHGLQYLGEADFFEMSDHIFNDSVRETLSRLGGNRLLREQYLDFLKCRRFRQTLLCRAEARLAAGPQAARMGDFLIASAAVPVAGEGAGRPPGAAPAPESRRNIEQPRAEEDFGGAAEDGGPRLPVDLQPGVNCVFETPKGARCQTDLPAGKAALLLLASVWPAPLPFNELLQQARERLRLTGLNGDAAGVSAEPLCDFLLQLYSAGVVRFGTVPPPVVWKVSERPVACPVVRWQAGRGPLVSSLFHVAIQIEDEIGRSLLSWLDGTLDHPALLEKLWVFLRARNALVIPAGGEEAARRQLEQKLEENLAKLARLGLLVG